MKQIMKVGTLLVALLAVSACAQNSSQSQVFNDYDYGYQTADVPTEGSVFRMNNMY